MSSVTTIQPELGADLTDLLEILGRTTDAMIVIDGELRIIAWNDAATTLLGYTAADALGRPCHEILCWRDRCGNEICDAPCSAMSPGEPDELIETRDVLGRSATGETLWLNASTIVPPLGLRDRCRLVHLVREIALPPELERLISSRLQVHVPDAVDHKRHLDVLTPREREVLQLLSQGLDGAAIAAELFVSPATVRNHIQHILTKLRVHNRVEAVAIALRDG